MALVFLVWNLTIKELDMGGGGGFGFSPTDKSQLEQKAKEKI